MASMHVSHLFLTTLLALIIISSPVANAAHCNYQKFPQKEAYTDCKDLPVLNAYIHYTYDVQNSTLSMAYIAKPEKPEGWVGWGFNTEGLGMVGSEALIAFKENGALIAKTYQLVSNTTIKESKLSVEVWDLAAEKNSLGQFIVFAKLKFPDNIASIFEVWNVGARVNNGMPMGHSIAVEHRSAITVLKLKAQAAAEAPADAPISAEEENLGVGMTQSGGATMTNNARLLILLPLFIASMVI